jgi:hypothetical protein
MIGREAWHQDAPVAAKAEDLAVDAGTGQIATVALRRPT